MLTTEQKVKKCYESVPFPDILRKAHHFQKELDKLVFWTKLNLKFAGIDFKKCRPQTILCAGCGTGEEVIVLSSLFPSSRILGIDISASSLKVAKENIKKAKKKNIKLKRMSILDDLPSMKKQFDMVYSSGVIHHLQNPKKGFFILSDKISEKGSYVISLYNSYGLVFYNLHLFILDILAGKNMRRRKFWALKLNFHDGRNETFLTDAYLNPQVNTYTIGKVKAWADQKKIKMVGICPPLSLTGILKFAFEGKNYISRRKGIVSLILDINQKLFSLDSSDRHNYSQYRYSSLRAFIFQIVYALLGKGECFYMFTKNKES